jgi:hypothetical protein
VKLMRGETNRSTGMFPVMIQEHQTKKTNIEMSLQIQIYLNKTKRAPLLRNPLSLFGGEGGIRTHGTGNSRTTVFEFDDTCFLMFICA